MTNPKEQPSLRQKVTRGLFEHGGRLLGASTVLTLASGTIPEVNAAANCKAATIEVAYYYYLDRGGQTDRDGSARFTDPRVDTSSKDEVVSPAPNRKLVVYNDTTGRKEEITTDRNGKGHAIFTDIPTDSEVAIKQNGGEISVPAVILKVKHLADDPQIQGIPNRRVTDSRNEIVPRGTACDRPNPIIIYEKVTDSQADELKRLHQGNSQITPTAISPEHIITPTPQIIEDNNERDNEENGNDNADDRATVVSSPSPARTPTGAPTRAATPTIDPRIIGTLNAQIDIFRTQVTTLQQENNELNTKVATLVPATTPTLLPTTPPASPTSTATPTLNPEVIAAMVQTATAAAQKPDAKPTPGAPTQGGACEISAVTTDKNWVNPGDPVQISILTNSGCNGSRAMVEVREKDLWDDDEKPTLDAGMVTDGKATATWNANFDGFTGRAWFEGGTEEYGLTARVNGQPKEAANEVEVSQVWYPYGYLPNWLGVITEVLTLGGVAYSINRAIGGGIRRTIARRYELVRARWGGP